MSNEVVRTVSEIVEEMKDNRKHLVDIKTKAIAFRLKRDELQAQFNESFGKGGYDEYLMELQYTYESLERELRTVLSSEVSNE